MYLRNKTTSFKLNFLSQWCYFRISLRFSLYLDVIYEQQLKLYLKGPCCLSSERVIITYRAYTYQFKRTFIKRKMKFVLLHFLQKIVMLLLEIAIIIGFLHTFYSLGYLQTK
uniref:Transmembrane protein n=1 Tax=Cacopsylla melanoneura TaxID=428564 RepID=A0A8D8T6I6_9HEMI